MWLGLQVMGCGLWVLLGGFVAAVLWVKVVFGVLVWWLFVPSNFVLPGVDII